MKAFRCLESEQKKEGAVRKICKIKVDYDNFDWAVSEWR